MLEDMTCQLFNEMNQCIRYRGQLVVGDEVTCYGVPLKVVRITGDRGGVEYMNDTDHSVHLIRFIERVGWRYIGQE